MLYASEILYRLPRSGIGIAFVTYTQDTRKKALLLLHILSCLVHCPTKILILDLSFRISLSVVLYFSTAALLS